MRRRALVLGAKSAIAQAVAERLALEDGRDLILAARQVEQLEPLAADLRLQAGIQVHLLEYDALDLGAAAGLADRAREQAGDFDLVVQAFGYLGSQALAERDGDELQRIVHTNFTAAALALGHLANYLIGRGAPGGIIGLGSVAGDRGRQSNYAYGSAKGALALYLQGLRNRLASHDVHVLTVKPGFVDTPMTAGLEGLFLLASPSRVASDIVRAYRRRRNVLYTPWFWRYLLLLVRAIPEGVFKRMQL
jgi:decaprenylphospho-beta-D-erythro-pentofuranosid-2-ulose 2-reductase